MKHVLSYEKFQLNENVQTQAQAQSSRAKREPLFTEGDVVFLRDDCRKFADGIGKKLTIVSMGDQNRPMHCYNLTDESGKTYDCVPEIEIAN